MAEKPTSGWYFTKQIFLRFVFVYFSLYFSYVFTFAFQLPQAISGLPIISHIAFFYGTFLKFIASWVGTTIFSKDIKGVTTLGTGDTTFDYLLIFCFIVISTISAVIWIIIDRKRDNTRLFEFSHLLLRIFLVTIITGYASSKIIVAQFAPPTLYQLLQPLGDNHPMGFMWSFMGHSFLFTVFTGVGEMIGGILLAFKRTYMLGAMILVTILSTIVTMNFGYNTSIKLFSSHLLIVAILILLPEAKRLANFLLFDKTAGPSTHVGFLKAGRLASRLTVIAKVLLALLIVLRLYDAHQVQHQFGSHAPKPHHYGIWDITEIEKGDKEGSENRGQSWRRVVFSERNLFSIQLEDDKFLHFRLKTDRKNRQFELSRPQVRHSFQYREHGNDTLELSGSFEDKPLRMMLKLNKDRKFILNENKFNWVTEPRR